MRVCPQGPGSCSFAARAKSCREAVCAYAWAVRATGRTARGQASCRSAVAPRLRRGPTRSCGGRS
eukprot:7298051-Alexandrium_andersonii.AAC.1